MKKQRIVKGASRAYILLSALSVLSVSIMAILDPQSVMDLVQVDLKNTDAYSSIRGVYGGVGLTIVIALIYLMVKDVQKGVIFLILLWGFYALSRTITIYAEGALGDFGTQWLYVESILCLAAIGLLFLGHRGSKVNSIIVT